MPTRSDTPGPPPGGPQRLHPFSWLFVLLQQLRAFAIPLVVLLVTGRGQSSEWLGLIGVAGLTALSVAQYFTYRYEPTAEGIVIRHGILQRTRRDIPYERIHTVNLHQTVLHRLFGVAEVRLESAGSREPEAVMRVLAMTEARGLEELVRLYGGARRPPIDGIADRAAAEEPAPLLTLGPGELFRLGLISNRGMAVVAAIVGLASQVLMESQDAARDSVAAPLRAFYELIHGFVAARLDDTAALAAGTLFVVGAALALVRLLSVVLAFVQYHGFVLREHERQLRVQRGLLTRVRHQLPRRRIQAWRIDETLLHRWLGRQTLRVDSAAGADDERGIRELAPVAPPATVTELLARLLPDARWPRTDWRPVHPRAWRRLLVRPFAMLLLLAAAVAWFEGLRGLVVFVAVPLLVLRARRQGAFAGYAIDDRVVAVRSGWLTRRWGVVPVAKLQSIRVTQSPFDRRHGMATLWLDTAGAPAADGVLRIRFLPVDEARQLYARLVDHMTASSPLATAPPVPAE